MMTASNPRHVMHACPTHHFQSFFELMAGTIRALDARYSLPAGLTQVLAYVRAVSKAANGAWTRGLVVAQK